jgi:hypothetical protein
MKYPHGCILEASYMVRDIHAAVDGWMKSLGAGPFFLGEVYIPADRHRRRGVPGPLSMDVAFGLAGDLLIELVQPRADDRSIYSEALGEIGTASHSQAINYVVNLGWSEGCALMSQQYEEVLHAVTNVDSLRCAIYDARQDVGAFIEVGEGIDQMLVPMIGAMKQCRSVWDGREIHPLEEVFKARASGVAASTSI